MMKQLGSNPMSLFLRAGFLGLLLAAAACPSEATSSYGYFRTVEGYASLTQAGSSSRVEIAPNYPLLVEDRVQVSADGRLETVLPDGSVLRLAGDTEILFERLAQSGDREDDRTLLQLIQGEMQLVVPFESTETEELRIDTVNTTVYISREGSYRIATDGQSWSEVVVREGWLEVVTEKGSTIVRAGEQALVDGESRPRVTLAAAAPLDSLERWGEGLTRVASAGSSEHVDPQLSYSAASLQGAGEWVSVGTTYAWRPHVAAGWRPYTRGWWTYTPSGVTWVSNESWGWVTHHYGSWSHWPAYGWVWSPGYTYYPANVYWYWGPSYVAWIPWGYYHNYYRPHGWGFGFGFRFGIYGWAGGHPGYWSDWTFCATPYVGHRNGHKYYASGAALTRRGTLQEVPQGVITTDTRGLTRDTWNSKTAPMKRLKANATRADKSGFRGRELTDVTDFVARRENLSASVKRAVSPADGERQIRVPTRDSGRLSASKQRPDREEPARVGATERSRVPSSSPTRSTAVLEWRENRSSRAGNAPTRATTPSPTERSNTSWSRAERSRSVSLPTRPETSRKDPDRSRSLSSTAKRSEAPDRSWRERSVSPPTTSVGPSRQLTGPSRSRPGTETPVVRRVIDGVRSNRSRGLTQSPSTPGSPLSHSPGVRSSTPRAPSSVSSPRQAPSRPSGQARSPSRPSGPPGGSGQARSPSRPSGQPGASGRSSPGRSSGSSRQPSPRKPPPSN
ncbi:MAG: DUF6600 domain-containing protein [Thermoanaerobaculia bacterium]